MTSRSAAEVTSLEDRVSALNASVAEARGRADVDRRRVDEVLSGLTEVCDERWSRYVEVMMLNSSLQQCRRANSDLVVDVQLTQLSDKTQALAATSTQLTAAIHTYVHLVSSNFISFHLNSLRCDIWSQPQRTGSLHSARPSSPLPTYRYPLRRYSRCIGI